MGSASLQIKSAGAFTSERRGEKSLRSLANQSGAEGRFRLCCSRQSAAPKRLTSIPPDVAVRTRCRTSSGFERGADGEDAAHRLCDEIDGPVDQLQHRLEEIVQALDARIRGIRAEAWPAEQHFLS